MPNMPNTTNTILQILECNYLGLTNTALIMSKMSKEFIESLFEGKTQIFDWYLFSRIMLAGGKGEKIDNTVTYYRIYHENVAGIPTNSLEELRKEIEIKIEHYKLLQKYDDAYSSLIVKYCNIVLDTYIDHKETFVFWWGHCRVGVVKE